MGAVYIAGSSDIPSHISLGRDESLDMVIVVPPGVSCDIPLTVDMDAEGADASISGLYLCGSEEKVSLDINVNHNAAHTTSHQLFNGVASGSSRAAFHGRIVVRKDCQGIKAFQENHNILLSEGATVESQPQLEIYADDVECSHGATTGFLNAEEQFYMRSRGIPEAEARVLQIISFLSPVVSRIADDDRREEIAAMIEKSVRSL